ncbi:glycerophosphodiester phosphodiesterase family protein [Microbacterium sediminis]|uniref:Glycerophosphodiester phosphodiesterase n=1 Tax=Microbacterium sediminis TaxID=904291 RepID=A0A1B9NGN4_9MICO|nr:glycerophosphodiester phosphodiesterase family protein [Microbacterium sediminis]OCG75758.1 glycerophosphodiester phosphodiesterase [Microbacterium sediminis]QBR74151.1 glycerophosphodiester phosphodiesterase [Microbacterium sediminis]
MTHPYLHAATSPRILAHRGLVPRDAPEIAPNTLAAFAAAHAAGVEFIETDCHLTADGELVLFHDDTLESITADPRRVDAVTAREMSEQLADRGGLVTLAQALEAFPTMRFNVDVKAEAAAVPAGRVAATAPDRVLLTSFSDARRRAALAAASPARPATSAGRGTIVRVLIAVLLRSRRLARRALRGIDALQVPERQGPIRVVTRRFLDLAHDAGCEVHVWTINDVARMRRLLAMGADGIVTDRADDAIAALR